MLAAHAVYIFLGVSGPVLLFALVATQALSQGRTLQIRVRRAGVTVEVSAGPPRWLPPPQRPV